jgi:hypothetical protein
MCLYVYIYILYKKAEKVEKEMSQPKGIINLYKNVYVCIYVYIYMYVHMCIYVYLYILYEEPRSWIEKVEKEMSQPRGIIHIYIYKCVCISCM